MYACSYAYSVRVGRLDFSVDAWRRVPRSDWSSHSLNRCVELGALQALQAEKRAYEDFEDWRMEDPVESLEVLRLEMTTCQSFLIWV